MMKHRRPNLLTMSPVLHKNVRLNTDGEEKLLLVERTGLLERISILFLNQPAQMRVKLDKMGQLVLERCNGSYSVQHIAEELERVFGEAAKPILPRLILFLQMVEHNGWIRWKRS